MADLDGASLEVVHQWFRENYGPNNAVLVLAGDIDAATARPLIERHFGSIARGADHAPAEAAIPTLPARVDDVMQDRVANTRIYRTWVVPGMLEEDDAAALQVGGSVLGGLASSRLDNVLVRSEQSAVAVSAGYQGFHRLGLFSVTVDVKPGQDVAAVSRRLDALIADFVASGPTEDEVRRAVMRNVSGRVQGLEQVGGFGGKAVALAEGVLYANDANFYRRRLQNLSRVTPAAVRASMQRWLNRPVYALRVDPGERGAYQEAAAVAPRPAAPAAPAAPAPAPRLQMPDVAGTPALDLPAIERARLSNGIRIVYSRRAAVPVTRVAVEFDAGIAADPAGRLGTQAMMLNMLEEGTTRLNSTQLAEAQERLGALVSTDASVDRTTVALTGLTPNLGESLDLLADIIRNPAFAPAEIERVRQQQLTGAAAELTQPAGLANRALPGLLYGAAHPYGRPFSGTGDLAVLRTLSRDELIGFHRAWIRPDNATIFVVSDMPLAQLRPLIEARFGNWRRPSVRRGTKAFSAAIPAPRPRIVLIDRPQSPQSFILAGQVMPAEGTQDLLQLTAANEALGSNFLSRINMELRERRGWSYGARGGPNMLEHQVPYVIQAPVQADRTGESIAAAMQMVRGFLTNEGVTAEEMNRIILGNTRQLPGQFETSGAVLGALRSNALYRRPDDYWERIADRYRGMTAPVLDQTARRYLNPDNFVWVVVGDAARIRPQLERLNMPIEVMTLPGMPAAPAPARPAQ
jgi:predicted Zn-dependent peptidase